MLAGTSASSLQRTHWPTQLMLVIAACCSGQKKPGKTREKTHSLHFVLCFGYFYWKYYKINSRKALYNYSVSIWTYDFSIWLCERPKANISMISRFVWPVGTLIYGFEFTQITFKMLRNCSRNSIFEKFGFGKMVIFGMWESRNLGHLGSLKCWFVLKWHCLKWNSQKNEILKLSQLLAMWLSG